MTTFFLNDPAEGRQYDKDKHKNMKIQITKMIHKISTTSERSVRKLLEILNMLDSISLTRIYDVDQDTEMFDSEIKLTTAGSAIDQMATTATRCLKYVSLTNSSPSIDSALMYIVYPQ